MGSTFTSSIPLYDLETGNRDEPLMAGSAAYPASSEEGDIFTYSNLASALTPAYFAKPTNSQKARGPTACLDGLRGWCALLVYISHHILGAYEFFPLEMGYGFERNYYFVSIPVLRTLFTGSHLAVHVFFILSGYVLSRGMLIMIRENAPADKILSRLASAVCRRFVRLWAPVVASTLIAMTISYYLGDYAIKGEQKASYLLQLRDTIRALGDLSFPLSTEIWMSYNTHLWTIPFEVRGSLYVFLGLLASVRMTPKARIISFSVVAYWFHFYGSWRASTFLVGPILAEIDLLEAKEWPKWNWLLYLQSQKNNVLLVLLFFALYVGGQPAKNFGHLSIEEYRNTYGFYYLSKFIPYHYENFEILNEYWCSFGAIFIILAVIYIGAIKRVFETRFMQYLGRICFGFYLVHGPILDMLGYRLYAATGVKLATKMPILAWNHAYDFGHVGPIGLQLNFLCCQLILLPITLYVAEICTKAFDVPSIRLANYLYQKTLP